MSGVAQFVDKLRARAEKAEADAERLRGLLYQAIAWIGDPSAYFGTAAGRAFDKDLQDELELGSAHDDKEAHDARVRLIVHAPAMARLLAKIRQTYVPDGEAAREIEDVLRLAGALDALPDWCRPGNL